MSHAAHNRFVDIDIAVPDFQVETTIRVGANPGFVMNSCPLTAKIRQGHQVSGLALLAFWKIELFHEVHLPTEIESPAVYPKLVAVGKSLFLQPDRANLTVDSAFPS